MLLVSNLATGVDLYDIPPTKPIRVLRHVIRKNVPLTIVPALGDSLAIVGSDDGCIRIFDQRTGSLASTLPHGPSVSCNVSLLHCLLTCPPLVGTLVQIVDVRMLIGYIIA